MAVSRASADREADERDHLACIRDDRATDRDLDAAILDHVDSGDPGQSSRDRAGRDRFDAMIDRQAAAADRDRAADDRDVAAQSRRSA
jgi:hypothetical protein